eukprot:jgi/Tetstr1/465752/TSEL_010377.t1
MAKARLEDGVVQIPSFLAHSLEVYLLLSSDLTPHQLLMLTWLNRFTFGVVTSGKSSFQVADVDEDGAVDAGVAAKDAFGSDELGQRTLDLLSSSLTAQTLKSYAGRLSQFAEFCHDSENISPLEATTATVVRYVA